MSDAIWLVITHKSATCGAALSVVINFILLLFLSALPLKALGPYKWLMVTFSLFSVFYTIVESSIKPIIHIYDDTCFIIQRKLFNYSHTFAQAISSIYCGCLAASFTLFAVHFIYRYWACCFPKRLKYFQGSNFYKWVLGVFLVSSSWAIVSFFCFPGNERTLESFKEVIQNSYNLNFEKVDYVAYAFWTHENGERNVDRIAMIGVFHHFIVMFISFAIVFYCGWNTVVEMRKHQDISRTTKKVQRQLFKALVFQTAFPMVFIYIPTLLVFLAPLFNMEIGAYGNIAIVTINLYPGIDPLILLVVISDFRNVLYKTPKKILNVTNSAIQRSTVLVDRF